MKIVNIDQRTAEWHDFRRKGITSTDIAAIMGESPYKTATQVFEEKIGIADDIYVSDAMRRGTEFEGEALSHISILLKLPNLSPACAVSDENPIFRTSLDGYCEVDDGDFLAEIKIPSEKNYSRRSWEEEYQIYKQQLNWHMLVTGAKQIFFFRYDPESETGEGDYVMYDAKLGEKQRCAALKFWEDFRQGIPPEEKPSYDQIEAPEAINLCEEYVSLSKEVKELEKRLKELKIELGDLGNGSNFILNQMIKFTKTAPRTTYDMQAMKKDGIDLNKYIKTPTSNGSYRINIV